MLGGSFLYGLRWGGDSPALKGQVDPSWYAGAAAVGRGPTAGKACICVLWAMQPLFLRHFADRMTDGGVL